MIAFWVAAGVLAAGSAGLILFRAGRAASQGDVGDPTPLIYRRQLTEIDELADRGLIAPDERRGAHAEAARRLLGATEQPGQAWGADPKALRSGLIAAILASGVALGIYLVLGSPTYPDQPFASRLKAWRASPPETLAPAEMAAVLQQLTQQRPNDPEGLRYLAIAQGAAQNPAGAVRALRRAVKIAPDRADLWEMLGEALIFQSGGPVVPDAQAAFRQALKRDPTLVAPRFHLARARIAAGDRAGGLADWRALLAALPANDPQRQALQAAILQEEGGPKPSSSLSGDQLTAVRGMVAGLAQRLQANPDDPQGWVRLVRAYAVLGQPADRDVALARATARYAANPGVLRDLKAAAAAEPMK